MNPIILTTRFNNKTWKENQEWREKNNWKGCIYGSPKTISQKINIEKDCIVIEMNNDMNKIMGFGYILNRSKKRQKKYKIYSDKFYNRFIYISKIRIDRDKIVEIEHLEKLEQLVFKGYQHMKRGMGFTIMPQIKMEENEEIERFIYNIFKQDKNKL